MTTTTRRRPAAILVLSPLLVLLLALAACGDDGGGGVDGVASLDEGAVGASDEGDDEGDGGDGGPARPQRDPEFEDAMLEYAQCMRDHGVDMPDPEFSDEGGIAIRAAEPGGGGPDDEEWQAADEACQPIVEEAMPEEMQLDPQEQAEMQDRLVEQAECMRAKGYDMADPQVDDKGRVTMRADSASGDSGPDADDGQFREDMEDCGGPGGPGSPGGPRSDRDDSDDGDDSESDGDDGEGEG